MIMPKYVENRSPEVRNTWSSIATSVAEREGFDAGYLAANVWLRGQVREQVTLARAGKHIERVSFLVDDSTEFISRGEDGEDYIRFTLSESTPDKTGLTIPEHILKKWADWINTHQDAIGDFDHAEYDKIMANAVSDSEVKELFKQKKGIAKAIRAVYEDGKLWVKAQIDKRYSARLNELKQKKGVSLEASLIRDENGSIIDGDLLGFTFTLPGNQLHPNAVAV